MIIGSCVFQTKVEFRYRICYAEEKCWRDIMNLIDLEFVIEVERQGSISKAAKELFVAQPNLSKVIKDLEKEFGILIFKRTSKGVVATNEGQCFIQKAKIIMNDVTSLQSEFIETAIMKEKLKISVPRASYITHAFTQYINTIPKERQISISFEECNSITAINNILFLKYGLGIIRYEKKYEEYFLSFLQLKGLEHESILEFDYQLLVSAKCSLVQCDVITEEVLDQYIEIIHGDTRLPGGEYLGILSKEKDRSDKPRKIYVYERGSQFDLLTMVPDTYMWVSPMPRETLERYGLAQIKCNFESKRMKDSLIYKAEHRKSPSEKRLIEMLNSTKKRLIKY